MHTLLKPKSRLIRIRRREGELAVWQTADTRPLGGWTVDGETLAAGKSWQRHGGVHTLAGGRFDVPGDWKLDDVRLELDLGGESLLHIAYDSGERFCAGLDENHGSFALAEHGGELTTETVARATLGVAVPNPKIRQARIVLHEPDVVRLVQLLSRTRVAAEQLEGQDVALGLLDAAEAALGRLWLPTATPSVLARESAAALSWGNRGSKPAEHYPSAPLDETARESVRAAVDLLVARLRALKERYPPQGNIALVGHAHIDTAWLWTRDETDRKLRRTFSTVADLLDRNDGFRFAQSFAEYYASLETLDPALLERIKGHVAKGRWEPVGGSWVEPDINMPTGESLARQLLYGQHYFKRTFGAYHRVAWLPDTFGFSPALPQLLKLAQMQAMYTIKLGWSETNRFPHTQFWWEGIDGSRILVHHSTHMFDGYNGHVEPDWILRFWRNHADKQHAPEALLPVGYGDGGGGPTQDMIDACAQLEDFPALPKVSFSSVGDFFDRALERPEAADLSVWSGELYLEYHRGVLTTQGRTKYLHRRAEHDLKAAEALAAALQLIGGTRTPALWDIWRKLLVNQFHDILPGSSIGEVYETTERELAEVVAVAGATADQAMDDLAATLSAADGGSALLLVNPSLSERKIKLESPDPLPGGQAVEGGFVFASDEVVEPFSARVLNAVPSIGSVSVSPNALENELLRVEVDTDGTLSAIIDKRQGRNVLDGRGNQIWAYADRPRWFDAWDVEEDYRASGVELLADGAIEIAEPGGQRGALRITRRIGGSSIVQDVRLWANSARLDFHTRIDWHERQLLLRTLFPVAIRSDTATFECAYGVHRRPTHQNTSWDAAKFEVAAHRFVDLSEPGYGVALLNDGRYGHDVRGNVMGISLLRCPVAPDRLADEGHHRFTYALLPHADELHHSDVLTEAEDLNRPLFARSVDAAPQSRAFLRVTGLPIALGALKPAEDGEGLILRAYEPYGARGDASIMLPPDWEIAGAVDLLEEPLDVPIAAFDPFEVKSLRLRRSA